MRNKAIKRGEINPDDEQEGKDGEDGGDGDYDYVKDEGDDARVLGKRGRDQ